MPLCSEASYVLNLIKIQKVRIPFGYVFLTRSDVCHGGLGGIKCNLRLNGSFHSNPHEDRGKLDYCVEPSSWEQYISENEFLKGGKAKEHPTTYLVKDETLKKEVGNIPNLLNPYNTFPRTFLDVLDNK